MYSLSVKAVGVIIAIVAIVAADANAQQGTTPYKPSHEEIIAQYKAAEIADSTVKGTIYRAAVNAHWVPGKDVFWYANALKDSVMEYVLVNAARGTRQTLPDRKALAERLLAETGQAMDSLPGASGRNRQFSSPPGRWESFDTDSLSPDKKYVAYLQDNNVYIRRIADDHIFRYTTDGSNQHPYGSLAWSPDSRYIVGYHITPVVDSPVYYILSSVPGTTRGQLRAHSYKQPGDPFTTYEMYLFPVEQESPVKVHTPVIDFFDAPHLYWAADRRYFYYEKVDRGHQGFHIIEVDALNGNTRTVVEELTKTFIYANRIYTKYLPKTHEIIWTSEKDGWNHIYLVDAQKGMVKREITRGAYVVRNVDSVDEQKREIWFSASGMNAGEDPYYVHYYRIGFDGKNLVSLTPAAANHTVVFSVDKKYYLDTWSTINTAPVTALYHTLTARKIMEVEAADISDYLAIVKRLPQPFVAKGRDGVTDIWGIYCVPSGMDTTRSYPVIENIYAGPQDAFVPKSFIGYNREMQSLADLGFIVVQIDGMGTANRSKAFHDVCWQNLADAGFADRILWMKALAQQHAYIDISRVGLYGTSAGGQNALGGLLFHPKFYKAGVAACGCHDNRIDKQWWNEQWMGYPVGEAYNQQSNVTNAARLCGDLLLIVGEADTNVPPESTYRVIDALIKAGKSFDFLPVPGMGHSDGGKYGRMKKRDFFVQHLLGVLPPQRNRAE